MRACTASLVLLLALGAGAGGCASGSDGPVEPPPAKHPEACTPGTRSCADGVATWCRPDGTLDEYECDGSQGLVCLDGGCQGPCAHETLGPSYLGCDYYPTVTPNPVY